MKVSEIMTHFQQRGTWVNWKRSCDRVLFGAPDGTVTKAAVAWKPTWNNLKRAVELGCDLFITHEPLYIAEKNEYEIWMGGSVNSYDQKIQEIPVDEEDVWVKKREWLDKQNLTVIRCHDFWDDFPDIGIHGAWAKFLGFNGKPINSMKFYETHSVEGLSLIQLVKKIQQKCKEIGQNIVHYIGNPEMSVHKIALGTGAITHYRIMHYELEADVLVLTDDGTRLWESAQWAEDANIGLIIVNHATAEEPGIRYLAEYMKSQFPNIDFSLIEGGCLYRSVGEQNF